MSKTKKSLGKIIKDIALSLSSKNMHVGGVIDTSFESKGVQDNKVIQQETKWMSQANNLMEADFGLGPIAESSKFGMVHVDVEEMKNYQLNKVVDGKMVQYDPTPEEGTPTYNEFYKEVEINEKDRVARVEKVEWLDDSHLVKQDLEEQDPELEVDGASDIISKHVKEQFEEAKKTHEL